MLCQWQNQCKNELNDLPEKTREACPIWKTPVLQYLEKLITEKEQTFPLPSHSAGF